MIAIFFLIVAIAYVAAAIRIAVLLRVWWLRITALLVAALIPTWDMIVQSIAVSDVCREVATVLHEAPRHVEGFALRSESLRFARELVQDGRYRYVEVVLADGRIVRVERHADGAVSEEPIKEISSRYLIDAKTTERPSGIVEVADFVVDLESNKRLVEQKQFFLAPTWVFRVLFGDLARNGLACSETKHHRIHLASEFLLEVESSE